MPFHVGMPMDAQFIIELLDFRSWLQADMQPPEYEVCLYEAFAVKVVLVCVA